MEMICGAEEKIRGEEEIRRREGDWEGKGDWVWLPRGPVGAGWRRSLWRRRRDMVGGEIRWDEVG